MEKLPCRETAQKKGYKIYFKIKRFINFERIKWSVAIYARYCKTLHCLKIVQLMMESFLSVYCVLSLRFGRAEKTIKKSH